MGISFSGFPKQAELNDVTLRDGLQNEKIILRTGDKVRIIHDIIASGVKSLEITSFVRPDLVPQLADAKELYESLPKERGFSFRVLVPNLRGYEKAVKVGCRTIVLFVSATEEHNRQNLGKSIDATLQDQNLIIEKASKDHVELLLAISMAFEKNAEKLEYIMSSSIDKGFENFVLCDTGGRADPALVAKRLELIKNYIDQSNTILHFHDTTGCAIANVLVSLTYGFYRFDAAVGGIGGCPFAEGAAGNISLEDLAWFLNSLGIRTGIDIEKLVKVNEELSRLLKRPLQDSKVARYLRDVKEGCLLERKRLPGAGKENQAT